jgi:hypothetical protein
MEAAESAFYWSLPTQAIINTDLPGARKARESLGEQYPAANQACIDIIDAIIKQHFDLVARITKLESAPQ